MKISESFDRHYAVDQATGCWNWLRAKSTRGYGKLSVNGRPEYAHRYSWSRINGAIYNGQWILHRCDNRACVNPDHMFIGDHDDNMKDMSAKGRSGTAKLSPEQASVIRHRFSQGGVTQCQLAAEFQVSHTTVWHLLSRKTFKEAA